MQVMKKLMTFFLMLAILSFGCSSENEIKNSGVQKVMIRLVDSNGQLIRENVSLTVSSIRTDFNSVAPFIERTETSGSYTFSIYMTSRMVVSAVAPNYNPVRKELLLEPSSEENITIDIVMHPRSGLRLMGYNVQDGWKHSELQIENFTNWVKKYDPDIILFCELNNNVQDETAIRTDEELLALSKQWGHDYATILKDWGYPTGITSRYEITDIEKVQLNTQPETGYRVHGFIQAKCEGLDLFAAHLSSQDKRTREIEAEEIARRASLVSYAVVSGDMNTDSRIDESFVPNGYFQSNHWYERVNEYSVMDKFLDAGLKDAFWLASTTYKASFPADRDYATLDQLGLRLDYMLLTPALAPRCDFFDILNVLYTRTGSDHFPTFMHLELND